MTRAPLEALKRPARSLISVPAFQRHRLHGRKWKDACVTRANARAMNGAYRRESMTLLARRCAAFLRQRRSSCRTGSRRSKASAHSRPLPLFRWIFIIHRAKRRGHASRGLPIDSRVLIHRVIARESLEMCLVPEPPLASRARREYADRSEIAFYLEFISVNSRRRSSMFDGAGVVIKIDISLRPFSLLAR